MVWTSAESPLYKCVERFNNTPREECCAADRAVEPKPCPKTECGCDKVPPKPDSGQRKCCNTTKERCEPPKSSCAPVSPRSRADSSSGNILQRLTSDRDFMLIAALIVLLLHEKADMKLIAALAFIILT